MISTEQKIWTEDNGWETLKSSDKKPTFVLVFAKRSLIEENSLYSEINTMYPDTPILCCSTAGEITGTRVRDNSISLTAISFEKTKVIFEETTIENYKESYDAGVRLAKKFNGENLNHVMVFSDGLRVNGTKLVAGFNDTLPNTVAVTGGLVADGPDFKKTIVGLNEPGKEGNIVALGFYGTDLHVGYGSFGGWDPFGLDRTVTKSKDNILYELDGQPALDLYKKYLGDQASGLPSTALLFPLKLKIVNATKEVEVVRTILAVDEKEKSMTFAGDIPEGMQATLMKANFERLIDGASDAGNMSLEALDSKKAQLAILVSCIGRKLVLKERLEEETEAVQTVLGENAVMTGFYSYGELCPVASTEKQCELHNQTMTITTFHED